VKASPGTAWWAHPVGWGLAWWGLVLYWVAASFYVAQVVGVVTAGASEGAPQRSEERTER
jgi:cardiolipin synthase (CMP-forming)